jgi:hypothetical protein
MKPFPSRPSCLTLQLTAAAALITAASTAAAGRPMATEDAAISDAGSCQLEVWSERSRDERSHWVKPACTPVDNLELALGVARVHGDGSGRSSRIEGHLKYLLRETTAQQSGYGLFLGELRDRGQPARAGERVLKGMTTIPLADEALVLHLNAGLARQRGDGSRRIRGLWSAALDRELGGQTRGFVEAFGTGGDRPAWQAGVQHQLVPGRLQLDASVGSVAGRWRDTHQVTVGLVVFADALLR